MKKLEKIESKIDILLGSSKHLAPPNHGCEEAEQKEILFKGVNIHRISADNPYTYGLLLMDALFTKEEMAGSLMFESKNRSNKGALDKERVAKIFKMIEERFKADDKYLKDWDLKLFIRKANQKCRDAAKCFNVKTELNELD